MSMSLYELFIFAYTSNFILGIVGLFVINYLSKKYLKVDIFKILKEGFSNLFKIIKK